MDGELTQLEKDILELRVKKGYTENETLEELNITKYQYNKIRKKLEDLELYSVHLVNKARKNRIARKIKSWVLIKYLTKKKNVEKNVLIF